MGIAAVKKSSFSSDQLPYQTGSNLSPVQSLDRSPAKFGVRGTHGGVDWPDEAAAPQTPDDERLLNARQVADKLGVSERFIRDHTTRRSPKIPAVKLGKLIRYRRADVDVFMAQLDTLPPSRRSRFGV